MIYPGHYNIKNLLLNILLTDEIIVWTENSRPRMFRNKALWDKISLMAGIEIKRESNIEQVVP